MNISAWMVLGLVSGLTWSAVMSRAAQRISVDLAVGVVGGVVGGLLFTMVHKGGAIQVGAVAMLVSLVGSVLGAGALLGVRRSAWPRRLAVTHRS